MSIIKKIGFSLFLLVSINLFGFTFPASSTNFYISDGYTDGGVKINYSAVVNAVIIDDFNGDKQLSLQLSSFLIEEAKYNDLTYRDNDIFGISFPIDTAAEITAEIQFLYGVKLLKKTIVLHPNKKTILNLKNNNVDFSDSQFNVKKTLSIDAIYDREIFIDDIKSAIEKNSRRKSPEAIEKEHTRLMVLGNNYLNENN